jgi:carbamoyltransferase
MLILGIHSGFHDGCAAVFEDYRMLSAVALERLTRVKIDGGRIPDEAIDECLAIAGRDRSEVDAVALSRAVFPWRWCSHLGAGRKLGRRFQELQGRVRHVSLERELMRARRTDSEGILDAARLRREMGFRDDCRVHFYNHHRAHALAALFHTDWDDALIYTADGGGDNVQYSHRVLSDGRLTELTGGDEALLEPTRIDSLGLAYGFATQALGYKINRHEGKVTGLAAFGRPTAYETLAAHFDLDGEGVVSSDFADYREMRRAIFAIAETVSREDMAASIQSLLENRVLEAVRSLLRRHPVSHLALSGGIFANVRLNQRLAEETGVGEIFVYPAMSDQGLAAGGALDFLLERDGLETWLASRYRIDHLYFGRDHKADDVLAATPGLAKVSDDPVGHSAELLAAGAVVGLYTNGMEYGPRALGARSILANPSDRSINDVLNTRLGRTEFMPFAPFVAAADADLVFRLPQASRYAARFMTVTCDVRPEWHDRIPAVIHVDGTARPQLIERPANPLYFDILEAFKARTGLPVLINTSFNVHEEPIINAPEECAQALAEDRVDYVATENGVYGSAKNL